MSLDSSTIQSTGVQVNGYTCGQCGGWVQWGVYHTCPGTAAGNAWVYPYVAPAAPPTVYKFKGSVEALDDLPKGIKATVGDAYYVKKADVLVVRVSNGWHHFDR